MVFVDLEGSYKSAPRAYGQHSVAGARQAPTPTPTPSVPAGDSALQATVDERGNVWNSQYQAWQDPSGNLWDSASGLWYDPRARTIWNEGSGTWQTPEQMQSYWDALAGHDVAIENTLGSQPVGQAYHYVPQEFTQAWGTFDRNTVAPTGEYPQVEFPSDTYDVRRPPTMFELEQQGRARQVASEIGGAQGAAQLYGGGKGTGTLSSILGKANKYFFDPIAETGAQLTPTLLKATGRAAIGPAFDLAAQLSAATGNFDINKSERAGFSELGSALRESGGNPLRFAEIQQENLRERPLWQQMGAQAVFDPTNLIGAGIGAKALQGGIKGGGTLSTILRGAAKADRAIDVAQAAAMRPVGKVIGAMAEPVGRVLAEEGGAVPTKFALKAGAATGAGALGYMTADEDASPGDRLVRALGFAAVPALGPEAIDVASRAYGKLPLMSAGLGRKEWLENAPLIDVLEGKDINPLLYLKDVTGSPGLPASAKISNAFWSALAKADRKLAATKLDDPAIYRIANMTRDNELRRPLIAEHVVRTASADFHNLFNLDDLGRVLDGNGNPLPILDADGNVRMFKGKPAYGALASEVFEYGDQYLAKGLVTPEQLAVLQRMADVEREVTNLRLAFGLPYEESPFVGPGGHLTRGTPTSQFADTTPTRPREPRVEGRAPGGSKAREIVSPGIGVLMGKKYPHPVDALFQYVDSSLHEVNMANASRNLQKLAIDVELRTGKELPWTGGVGTTRITLGDLLKNAPQQEDYVQTVQAIRAGRREVRKLSQRQARIDRDARLSSKWVETNRRRAAKLSELVRDQTISASARAEAASNALALTKTAFKDARAAAADYARLTAKTQVKESDARRALNTVLDQADAISKELDKIEDAIRSGNFATELAVILDMPNAAGNPALFEERVAEAWKYADGIRAAAAADAAALERRLANLPYEDVAEDTIRAREALKQAKNNFSGSLRQMSALEREAEKLARLEADAAANVRATLNKGRLAELERLTEQRAERLRALADQSSELQARIDFLKENLLPLEQHRDEIKADVRRVRDLVKELSAQYPTGTIKLKGWENVHMPHYLANAWTKYERGAKGFSGKAQLFDLGNNAFRALGASFDASRTATTGLLGLATDPSPTLKGIVAGVEEGFIDPDAGYRHLRAIEEAAQQRGIDIPLAEAVGKGHLELTSSEHMLRGLADEGTLAARLAKKPGFRQAESLYGTSGMIDRAQRFYDNIEIMRLRGEDWRSDRAIAAAANAANVTTGRATRGALAPIIGDVASSRVLFAGRFVQSQIDAVFNAILVGGIEGETARRGLLRLLGGGAALTYAINEAQGRPTDFALFKDGRLNPDFLKTRVAGQDISLFGPWDSLIKGLAATAQGDPDYFLRSKLAPFAGVAWDMTLGRWRDPLDRPIDTPEGLARMLPIPFAIRNIMEQARETDEPSELGGLGLSVATSMLGIKSSPLTPREQYTELLKDAYKGYEPTLWDGRELQYPQPKDVYEDPLFIREYAASHPDEIPGPATELGKEMKEIRDDYGGRLDALNRKFATDQITLGDWKEQRKMIKDEQRTLLEPLNKKMEEALGHDPTEGSPSWWMDKYFQTFDDAKDPDTQQIDLDALDRNQAAFFKEAEAAGATWVADYIDAYTLAGGDPGPEREYLEAIQQLDRDGFFSGGMPRYIGMVSGMTDGEIDRARELVNGHIEKWPELKDADYLTKAFVVLEPMGYSAEQILDVSHAGKKDYQDPIWRLYKAEHPGLIEWLEGNNYYSTIQAVNSR